MVELLNNPLFCNHKIAKFGYVVNLLQRLETEITKGIENQEVETNEDYLNVTKKICEKFQDVKLDAHERECKEITNIQIVILFFVLIISVPQFEHQFS